MLALLLGFVAGLRAMTAPALVSWAAYLGWLDLSGTWLAFLGNGWACGVLTLLALGELVTDQLPTTPSRTVPVQFGARIVTGALTGAAIGAASGLGAIVRANDTRPEVADQIKSLGGEFVPVEYEEEGSGVGGYAKVMSEGFQKAQREVFAKQAKDVDIIITTALIPGKPAPKLITEDMVKSMKQGSVIVDLAAEQGGNCELTVPGEIVVRHGVTIIGYKDLPSRLPKNASFTSTTTLPRLRRSRTSHQRPSPASSRSRRTTGSGCPTWASGI